MQYVLVVKVIQNANLSFNLKVEINLIFQNIFLLVGCLCVHLCNTELHDFIHKEIYNYKMNFTLKTEIFFSISKYFPFGGVSV